MKKQFVPYNISLQLKELGFDGECLAWYTLDGEFKVLGQENVDSFHTAFDGPELILAPLWQQAIDFLLNKVPNNSIRICYNKTGEIEDERGIYDIFHNYEECLNLLIEICKSK